MNISFSKEEINPFPSNRIIRRMGYSNDQDGIMQRFINEEGNWNEHLQNSKNYIQETVEDHKPDTIAILGSGWLLDVPIEILAEKCKKVYLYDIRHPKPIVNRMRKYNNIECVSMDITGGLIEYIFRKINNKDYTSIAEVPYLRFEPIKAVDYTISVNLLNQLDILIVEYLRRFPKVSEESIRNLRKEIQFAHLKNLSVNKSCIISDYEELIFDRTGKLIKTSSLVFNDFPLGKNIKEWIWRFDTNMTYYPNRKTHFKVKAIQL